MTPQEYYAERREAGRKLDPEHATVFFKYAQEVDPYGIWGDVPPELDCINRVWFAYSQEHGLIRFDDLPAATQERLVERVKDGDTCSIPF